MRPFLVLVLCVSSLRADPLPIGHRGLIVHAPENTLPGFTACLQLRIGFELDVQRTSDGHLVVMHDTSVDRTTNGKGKVSDMTLAEVRKLDAGSKFDPAFRDVRVPTFDEVFDLLAKSGHPDTIVTIDLKIEDDTVESELVALATKSGVLDRVVFIGLTIEKPIIRQKLRKANVKTHVAILAQTRDNLQSAIDDADSDWVYARFVPTADEVKRVHTAKKKIILVGPLFMSQLPENWKAGRIASADAIMTDYPLECRQVFREVVKETKP